MQSFDYKIKDKHLTITCGGQSHYYYIGAMVGVDYARIWDNQPNISLEIAFPSRLAMHNIAYTTPFEGAALLKKGEQLIQELIAYTQSRNICN
jgi:hypothetical protein